MAEITTGDEQVVPSTFTVAPVSKPVPVRVSAVVAVVGPDVGLIDVKTGFDNGVVETSFVAAMVPLTEFARTRKKYAVPFVKPVMIAGEVWPVDVVV